MGRAEEIAKIEADIQKAAAQRQKIADGYTAFANRISGQIEKILKDAEVYDVIRAIEVGRDKRRQDDQAQADALGKHMEELVQMRAAILEEKQPEVVDETTPSA